MGVVLKDQGACVLWDSLCFLLDEWAEVDGL